MGKGGLVEFTAKALCCVYPLMPEQCPIVITAIIYVKILSPHSCLLFSFPTLFLAFVVPFSCFWPAPLAPQDPSVCTPPVRHSTLHIMCLLCFPVLIVFLSSSLLYQAIQHITVGILSQHSQSLHAFLNPLMIHKARAGEWERAMRDMRSSSTKPKL